MKIFYWLFVAFGICSVFQNLYTVIFLGELVPTIDLLFTLVITILGFLAILEMMARKSWRN